MISVEPTKTRICKWGDNLHYRLTWTGTSGSQSHSTWLVPVVILNTLWTTWNPEMVFLNVRHMRVKHPTHINQTRMLMRRLLPPERPSQPVIRTTGRYF